MPSLEWHIEISVRRATSAPTHAADGTPFVEAISPGIKFQDSAGLRDPTEEELDETREEAEWILSHCKRAATAESARMDKHETEKEFYFRIREFGDEDSPMYSAEVHLDSLSGSCPMRGVAFSRLRAVLMLPAGERKTTRWAVYPTETLDSTDALGEEEGREIGGASDA